MDINEKNLVSPSAVPETGGRKEGEKVEQTVEVAEGFKEEYLKAILELEKECFPPDWQYEDAEEYYKTVLENPDNFNFFLKENDKILGYMLAVPLKDVYEELSKYDHELKNIKGAYYFETVSISLHFQRKGGFMKFLEEANKIMKAKGVRSFTGHNRITNKMNQTVRKFITHNIDVKSYNIRYIEKWHLGGEEPYEFSEWHL